MALFSQTPFAPNSDDRQPMPFDTASAVQKEIAQLANNYKYGNLDVRRRIDKLNYPNYAPASSPQEQIVLAPLFLPSRITY